MPKPPTLCSPCCSADEVQVQTAPPKPVSIVKDKTDAQYDRMEKLLLQVIEDVNRNMCDVKQIVEDKIHGFDQILQSQINRLVEIDRIRQEQSSQQAGSPQARTSCPVHAHHSQTSLASCDEYRDTFVRRSVLPYAATRSLGPGESQCGIVGIEELPEKTHHLFEAVRCSDTSLVRSLLEGEGDPNVTVSEYRLGPDDTKSGKTYKPCSLLGLAVLGQDYKMAELLIASGSDPDSIYGFSAGAQRLAWSAPCSHSTIAKHNVDLLDLLVRSRADPHASSSSGANLLWQCSYFGDFDMLDYLLNLGVSHEPAAEHPDLVGVSHTPLHIAAIRGHHSVVASLLVAKARHELRNEMGMTALDDAILQCRPSIVSLLVAKGADLYADGTEFCSRSTRSVDMIRKPTRRGRFHGKPSGEALLRPIDRVFLLENPVVMSAVAEGLWYQEKQMQLLTIDELVRFLSTPGDTPEKILKALFRERRVFYWEQSVTQMVRKDITTALIPKPRVLPSGALAENMNVAALPMSYSDFAAKSSAKAPLSSMAIERLLELAPQQVPGGCLKEQYLMTSVSLYECLIQDVHKDLLVILTISKLHHTMLGHKPAQAILQHCWTKVMTLQIFDVFIHLLLMLDFIAISLILQHPTFDFGIDRDVLIQIVACLGLLCAAVHFINEVLQCVAFHVQGWLCDYMTDVGNYIDYLRIGGDITVLFSFLGRGHLAADSGGFRVIFASLCFYKWIKLLSSLKPFRAVGPQILPILEAMQGVGAFFVVLLCHMMGLWHSYITLEPARILSFDVWYMVYRIALIGDYSPYEFSGEYPESSYYIVRVFYMLVALLVTITLMNVFISALGNEFTTASDNIETIFEHCRAKTILSHMAVRAGIRRMIPEFQTTPLNTIAAPEALQETLWFCLSARDRSD